MCGRLAQEFKDEVTHADCMSMTFFVVAVSIGPFFLFCSHKVHLETHRQLRPQVKSKAEGERRERGATLNRRKNARQRLKASKRTPS